MSIEPAKAESQVESRLTALEETVARLSALVEPLLAVSGIAAPIASVALKDRSQHQFSAKFFALLDLGESLIKYSSALAFATTIHNRRAMAESVIETFKTPPTLGKLAGAIRNVLDDPSGADWPVDSIRDAFRRAGDKPGPTAIARYLFDEFLGVRNTERGHGAQQPEGYYEDLYFKHCLTVHDCVEACKFVQLPLVHIRAVDHTEGLYSYKATLLMGISPSSTEVRTSLKVTVGSTCVWDYGSRLVPLHDFVAYRYCPVCMLEHVFFAERMTSDRTYFHSYVGNHRFAANHTVQ